MKNKSKKSFFMAISFLVAFVLWTLTVLFVDVKSIGPNNSIVGLATINGFFHKLTGVHMWLYVVTDWLGLMPIAVALVFAWVGLFQWIKRKSFLKVDKSILLLGVFYILVFLSYVLFEFLVINYRPILINGILEASYPSSTTMLVLCIMPTASMQINRIVKNKKVKTTLNLIIILFTLFMVGGRFISGVHWFSDIIGGILLSGGLCLAYFGVHNLSY